MRLIPHYFGGVVVRPLKFTTEPYFINLALCTVLKEEMLSLKMLKIQRVVVILYIIPGMKDEIKMIR